MASGEQSGQVVAGVGHIWVAPIGTTEPTSVSSSLDSAWKDVGYTSGGVSFTYEITTEEIYVDQEFDPIRIQTVSRSGTIAVPLAQASVGRLALALNQGAAIDDTAEYIEPPDPGDEVRVMVLLEAENGGRWLWRQCINSSSLEIAFSKAPDQTLLPIEFKLEKPTGQKLFKVWGYGVDGLIA